MPWNRSFSNSKEDNEDEYDEIFTEEEQKKFEELDAENETGDVDAA